MISTDLRFAAELGTVKRLSPKEMALMRNVLRSFDNGEATMAGAFRGEARYMYKAAQLTMYRNAQPMDRFLYKRNATHNRMYACMQQLVRLAELAPERFAAEAKAYESMNTTFGKAGLPFLYNPAGEIMGVISQGQGNTKYIERGHNLEGLRRLAWLKVLAKKEHVLPEQMQQFLDAKSGEFKDPYTSGPMKWDRKKGFIYFKYGTEDKQVEMFL
jgi:hypothetical protein